MTRRAWGILLAALVIIAAVLAFNVAPAAADEPERYEAAGHACDYSHSIWWEDGVLVSVNLQFDVRMHTDPVTINGVGFDATRYVYVDSATVLRVIDELPTADAVTVVSGDCTATLGTPPVATIAPEPIAPEPIAQPAPDPVELTPDVTVSRYDNVPRALSRVLPSR